MLVCLKASPWWNLDSLIGAAHISCLGSLLMFVLGLQSRGWPIVDVISCISIVVPTYKSTA